jgi:hypothetical protein
MLLLEYCNILDLRKKYKTQEEHEHCRTCYHQNNCYATVYNLKTEVNDNG